MNKLQRTINNSNDTDSPAPMQRFAVVGNTGSGKTTLARYLSRELGIPHVELDVLHWEANWTPADASVFRERTAAALSGDKWVSDGNYSKVRDLVWRRADTLVWLDYPLALVWWRLLLRTVKRIVRRELLWGKNYETLRGTLLSRESLLLYALTSHRRCRREYPLLFQRPEYAHLTIFRLRSPGALECWLASLAGQEGRDGKGELRSRAEEVFKDAYR